MATKIRGEKARPFPAPVIASLLFLVCLFPGQHLISGLVPGISGLATINPSLVVFDIPIHLPITIDLILLPVLFFVIYTIVILVYPSRPWRETFPRLGAALAGSLIFLIAAAAGGLISYLVQDSLPKNVRNGIDSLGIAADISLPFSTNTPIHLPGNVITLLALVIGFAICIARISKTPGIKKTAPLTREQRMTPYERMKKEKAAPQAQKPMR